MRRRRGGLALQYYEKLFDLAALAFDVFRLCLFDLVVQLEFLFGLVRLAEPIIRHAKAVVGLTQLRVRCDRLRVVSNGPVIVAF